MNKPLNEKRALYMESSFKSVRDFVNKCDVEPFDPESRAVYMANIIHDELINSSKKII